ncbi:MAG: lysophospholipid acyltransferase family protein [Rhodospirillales bacterium]|tara:strand:- start:158 stop:883 length:726 start_codon:yes stop_codon:yes gene_type:complete
MQLARSVIFNFLFHAWTGLTVLLLWLAIPLSPSKFRTVISIWPKGCFLMLKLLKIEFEIRGENNIADEPVLYAVKHQSVWETIFFLWHNKENAYVMKSELARIPFWGWYMERAAHILVDRKGGIKSMKGMLEKALSIKETSRSIVIFPEGTRMPPGTMGKLHPGVAALYKHLNISVVPVAVNSGLLWPRRQFKKKQGKIIIEFLNPIPSGMEKRKFLTELSKIIYAATLRLEKEGGYKNIQ